MMVKRLKKKDYIKIILILLALFLIFGVGLYFFGKTQRKEEPINVSKVENVIEKYGYYVNDNANSYYKEQFKILKEMVENEEINEEDVVEQIAKLYVIDLLSLNDKINKYEVTSSQYFYSTKKTMNTQKIIDIFYNTIIDNAYDDRIQELPEVKKVEIIDIKKNKYTLDKDKVECYEIIIDVEYQKDLGYDKKVKVILVKDGETYGVVSYKNEE